MGQISTPPRRRLKSVQEVAGNIGRRRCSTQQSLRQESQDYSVLQTDETTDLNYFVMSLPKDLSFDEKVKRIAILANKVTDVEESDVICMALWVPSDT
jgi:hypothetical protein